MRALLLGAAVLGIIIAVMEREGFPGWDKMVLCVLAAVVPSAIVNALLPPELFFIGMIVGAVCAAVAIALICGMTVKRAAIAAGIYLGIQIALVFAVEALFRT